LRRALPKDAKIILELGAWRGQTTRFLAETCPNATILAVDTWHGGQYRQPEHPEWKAMLPDVWQSFVANVAEAASFGATSHTASVGALLQAAEAGSFGYGRVIPLHRRHDDAVRELAAAGRVPDVIYFDPDYNTRLVRETLGAIVRCYPHVPLVGHDWLWHRVQREVSQASRQTGRRLDSRGNLWFLAPVARPLHAEREGYFAPSRSGNGKRVPGVEPIGEPPVRAAGGSASLRPQPPNLQQPIRVLITIPHFYRAGSSRLYGSGTESRKERMAAVSACLGALFETWGSGAYAANLARPENLPANGATQVKLNVVLCVSGKDHLLDALELPDGSFETRSVRGDPLFLGYACHEVLRERLGQFDYYVYMEDDLVLTDPWTFAKLRWFTQMVGEDCLLQPNRFEVGRGLGFQPDVRRAGEDHERNERSDRLEAYPTKSGRLKTCPTMGHKAYIDGDLPLEKTARYQDISIESVLRGRFLGSPVGFRRTTNPHAGCFFLTEGQMRVWSAQPYFLDRDASFYSPLEGAATVGIMRTFRTYKPARENANFFEIRHMGDGWMKKLAERDRAVTATNRWSRRGGQAQFAPKTSAI
jgi:hypothetical protein